MLNLEILGDSVEGKYPIKSIQTVLLRDMLWHVA
jgi:hypothetical protein